MSTSAEAVMKFQTRKMYVRGKLLFLTSSQSVPVRSNTDSANSFLTPGLDTCCNDDSGETIQTDSIFTGDLQLNWSGFTAERMEQLKRYIKGRRQLKEREHTTTAILKGSKSKGKSKKKEPAKKRRNAKMNQEEEAIEDSDEGDFDDRELDYITDSGESDADLDEKEKEDKYDDKGVDQEHGLKKLIDSEEESCEEENKEEENEEEEETKEEEKKKKKKEGGEESDSSSSSSGSESDIEKDEKISSVLFMQKKKGGSRSSTPTIPEDKEKQALKRKLESDEGAAKKSRTDSPLTTGPISSGEITEDTIRRYLMWKPMTAKELVQKFKSKLPQMTKEQMTQKIGQVLKKINPDRKYVNNILYLSVKKKD